MKYKILLSSVLIFYLSFSHIFANDPKKPRKTVPWDSVMAEIQTVHFLRKPDSLKAGYYRGVFQKFNIDSTDYAKFYYDFQTWKPKRIAPQCGKNSVQRIAGHRRQKDGREKTSALAGNRYCKPQPLLARPFTLRTITP